MSAAELAAIEARFHAGTLTDIDIRALLSELRGRPTVREVLDAYREAGEEFDRLVSQ